MVFGRASGCFTRPGEGESVVQESHRPSQASGKPCLEKRPSTKSEPDDSDSENESGRLPDGTIIGEDSGSGDLPDGSVIRWHEALFGPTGDAPPTPVVAGDPDSTDSLYGFPVSPEEAAALLPAGGGGLIWKIQVVGDEWKNPRLFQENGEIKPRRGACTVRSKDLLASLVQTADGRWIFSGVLNGWPGMTCLELRSLTQKRSKGMGKKKIERVWDAKNNPDCLAPPLIPGSEEARATMHAAPSTARGWSPESPHYAWWVYAMRPDGPQLAYGEGMIARLRSDLESSGKAMPQATQAHIFAYRYSLGAGRKESTKDKLTYHAAVLLEWDHGEYTTAVELACYNGVSGRHGKSDYYHDRIQTATPPVLVAPFRSELAEIRCNDIPSKSREELLDFMREYEGMDKRFLDPQFQHSAPVRIHHKSQEDIIRYCMHYMARDVRYTQEWRNCQSFAADFFSFLCGKKDIEPFSFVCRAGYKPRSHLFLYDPDMYKAELGPTFSPTS